MANYMAEVAKMLGVELGEKFKVAERGCRYETVYYFDRNGAWDEDGQVADAIIPALLIGSYEIVKLPWKPKIDEQWYFPDIISKRIVWNRWEDDTRDYAMLTLGICYRTKEEAEAHLAEDYKKLTGKELGK